MWIVLRRRSRWLRRGLARYIEVGTYGIRSSRGNFGHSCNLAADEKRSLCCCYIRKLASAWCFCPSSLQREEIEKGCSVVYYCNTLYIIRFATGGEWVHSRHRNFNTHEHIMDSKTTCCASMAV